MFGGEASEKKVRFLSGGERSRLAMIRLLLEPVNLLILDEPTNHLDMRSKDVLKEALMEFDGTVICVSHDRDFLAGLASKVYEFGDGKVREHLGGIYDWLRYKKAQIEDADRSIDMVLRSGQASKQTVLQENVPTAGKLDYAAQKAKAAELRKAKKAVDEAEADIAKIENEIAEMEGLLAEPANQTQERFTQYEQLKHRLEQRMYEWELLSEQLDSLYT